MKNHHITFMASDSPVAQQALQALVARYGNSPAAQAQVIVALGGDGFMLHTLHQFVAQGIPIYGMNRGSVGFLMNDFDIDDLPQRLAEAEPTLIRPLRMIATNDKSEITENLAFNEVSFLRQRSQAAKLCIEIDGKVRLDELVCDGILLATAAGSTAYNLSAHGPILPVDAPLLALTPISAFRPRRWRGAILPRSARVTISVQEADKRPVAAVADHDEVRNVVRVEIAEAPEVSVTLLFDQARNMAERVLSEQFRF